MASFAYAAHHLLSTFTNIVEGNQQTAQMMEDDVLRHPLPITHVPTGACRKAAGLGIEVDCEKVGLYHECYRQRGRFPPYGPALI